MKGVYNHPHPPVRCIYNANMDLGHGLLLKRLEKRRYREIQDPFSLAFSIH